MKIFNRVRNLLFHRLIALANTAQEASDNIVLANAQPFTFEERKPVELSPYGDFPHSMGLQRFTKKEAASIVANFDAEKIKGGARFGGLPFFIGHPDVPQLSNTFKDTKAYGWIESLVAQDNGLFANVKWTDEGEQLVKGGAFKFLSPVWIVQRGEKNVVHPAKLRSVGLTNTPNIPVAPLANDKTQNQGPQMYPWLVTMLGLSADATEDQVKTKMTDVCSKATAAANTVEFETSRTALTNEQADHKKTKDALANERKARAEIATAAAVKDGRITLANVEQWNRDLVANDAKFGDLAALVPVVKTEAQTKNLKGQKTDLAANVVQIVHKRMKDTGESYDSAWANVKKSQPELFANMKQPEAKE